MAKLTIIRLSQSPNQYGSFSYRIVEGEPETDTKLYGDNNDIIYCNQKIGVWNTPTEVEQFLGKSKNGKTYTGFSVDKELNNFRQRGHTATLAVKSGLNTEKIEMLQMLAQLDEQELKVMVMQKQLKSLPNPTVNQRKAVSPPPMEDAPSEVVPDEAVQ